MIKGQYIGPKININILFPDPVNKVDRKLTASEPEVTGSGLVFLVSMYLCKISFHDKVILFGKIF